MMQGHALRHDLQVGDSAAHLWENGGKDLQLAARAALEQLDACIDGPSQAGVHGSRSSEELGNLAQQRLDLQSCRHFKKPFPRSLDCCHYPKLRVVIFQMAPEPAAAHDRGVSTLLKWVAV